MCFGFVVVGEVWWLLVGFREKGEIDGVRVGSLFVRLVGSVDNRLWVVVGGWFF